MADVFGMFLESVGKLPAARVDREEYLRKAFRKYHDNKEMYENIVRFGPRKAGVMKADVDKVADDAINLTAALTTATSFVAGIPGGLTMAVTIPGDLLQLYGQMFVVVQKLMYIYGWEENIFDSAGEMDDATKSTIILYFGLMFGVGAVSKPLAMMAAKTGKKAVTKAVTKAIVKHPVVFYKTIIKHIGLKSTKELAKAAAKKAVPIISGVISGAITLATFIPMAKRLKRFLSDRIIDVSEEPDETELEG